MARRSEVDPATRALVAGRRRVVLALVVLLLPILTWPVAARAEDPDGDRLPTWFELGWSHTDPAVADTDGDGVRDGAEDPDRDGLSNAGERRYHDDPLQRNTDGTGPDDWHGDTDGDGIADGLTQDRRLLPDDLLPSVADAATDRPVTYRDGCHLRRTSVPRRCFYGDLQSPITVVVFGDSHAASWIPGIIALGERRGWRILPITRSACPAAAVAVDPPETERCRSWRRAALALIADIRPDLVLAASFGGYSLWEDWRRVSSARRVDVWREGWTRILRRLVPLAGTVALIADVPLIGREVVACLEAHPRDVSACTARRSATAIPGVRRAELRAAATAGARWIGVESLVCPYDPCPVVVDRWLIYLDPSHLTATYSEVLAPGLERRLPGVWGAPSGGVVGDITPPAAP